MNFPLLKKPRVMNILTLNDRTQNISLAFCMASIDAIGIERVKCIIDICLKFVKFGLLVNVVCLNIQNVICDKQKKNMKNIMIVILVT